MAVHFVEMSTAGVLNALAQDTIEGQIYFGGRLVAVHFVEMSSAENHSQPHDFIGAQRQPKTRYFIGTSAECV